jgi:uncharacterized protein
MTCVQPTTNLAVRTRRIRLLVLAKAPVAGRVKTRLCPPLLPAEAAEVAAAAIADTMAAAAAAVPLAAVLGFRLEPVLVLDGSPKEWLVQLFQGDVEGPIHMRVVAQRGDQLDSRLAAAFEDAAGDIPALLIGMDTPQVTSDLLVRAVETLAAPDCDAVLGHAEDGGWWLLGLRQADPGLLHGVPMSTPYTGAAQEMRLLSAGLRVAHVEPLLDVDTVEDAERVAALAPNSRFARTFHRLRHPPRSPGD